jgi:hypothetical protein
MALAILATLVIGLLATAAFAALAVGTLNLISVAFAIFAPKRWACVAKARESSTPLTSSGKPG